MTLGFWTEETRTGSPAARTRPRQHHHEPQPLTPSRNRSGSPTPSSGRSAELQDRQSRDQIARMNHYRQQLSAANGRQSSPAQRTTGRCACRVSRCLRAAPASLRAVAVLRRVTTDTVLCRPVSAAGKCRNVPTGRASARGRTLPDTKARPPPKFHEAKDALRARWQPGPVKRSATNRPPRGTAERPFQGAPAN